MIIKNWKNLLPLIGIVLFVYVIFRIDIRNVISEITRANKFFIFIAFIFLFIMMVVQTFKWYYIARIQKINIPFKKALEVNIISNFYGFVTPSRAGGVVRAEYLREYTENKNIGKGLFNFIIDKIFDILSIIFLAILFSFVFKDKLDIHIAFFITLFLIFSLATLIFIKKERSKFFLGFIYRKLLSNKIKNKVKITFDTFYENVPKKRYLALFFIFSIISWILIYIIFYFIGLSLSIQLSFIHYLAILPIGTLVAMLPISISGLGTRELTLISLFGLFNVPAAKVFSMSLIDIVIVGIIPSIIGIILILRKNKEN